MSAAIFGVFVKFFFSEFLYPLFLAWEQKRAEDPAFKALSDATYAQVRAAATSADRQSAARKLYELQNS